MVGSTGSLELLDLRGKASIVGRKASVLCAELAYGGGDVRKLVLPSSVLGRQASDGSHEAENLLLELKELRGEGVHDREEKRGRGGTGKERKRWVVARAGCGQRSTCSPADVLHFMPLASQHQGRIIARPPWPPPPDILRLTSTISEQVDMTVIYRL